MGIKDVVAWFDAQTQQKGGRSESPPEESSLSNVKWEKKLVASCVGKMTLPKTNIT